MSLAKAVLYFEWVGMKITLLFYYLMNIHVFFGLCFAFSYPLISSKLLKKIEILKSRCAFLCLFTQVRYVGLSLIQIETEFIWEHLHIIICICICDCTHG